MSDLDLEFISKYCVSLGYLNIKGCISVTDVGISNVICRCIELHSIVVCNTSFGMNSILALCSAAPKFGNATGHFGKRASNLLKLHIGCCKGEYFLIVSFSIWQICSDWIFIVFQNFLWFKALWQYRKARSNCFHVLWYFPLIVKTPDSFHTWGYEWP